MKQRIAVRWLLTFYRGPYAHPRTRSLSQIPQYRRRNIVPVLGNPERKESAYLPTSRIGVLERLGA